MEEGRVFHRWFKLIVSLLLIGLLYLFVLPFIANSFPQQMQSQIENQDIDSRSLFYTENDDALRAYYFLRLDPSRKK